MEVMGLIDNLEDLIDKGIGIPFIGKCLLDKQELLEIIEEIRIRLPDDLKQAKWVKEERQRIINEAQKESNNIIKNAEEKTISLINDHEITKMAQDRANEIITRAQKRSREINEGTIFHVEEMLSDAEKVLESTLTTLRNDRNSMRTKQSKKDKQAAAKAEVKAAEEEA